MYTVTVFDHDGMITKTLQTSKAASDRYVAALPRVLAKEVIVRNVYRVEVGKKRVGVSRIAWNKATRD